MNDLPHRLRRRRLPHLGHFPGKVPVLLLVELEIVYERIFIGKTLPESLFRREVEGGIGSQFGQHLGKGRGPRNSTREGGKPVDKLDEPPVLVVDLLEARFEILVPEEDLGKNVGRKSGGFGRRPLFHGNEKPP